MTPRRIPSTSTPAKATIEMPNSNRLICHSRRRPRTSISPLTATRTIAASTTVGRLRSRPVRNSRHNAIVVEANTSASGVLAPALSFTDDCDRPPATG